MIKIKLNNSSIKEFDAHVNGFQIAKEINDENLKNYVAMEVNGEVLDLSSPIDKDSEVKFIDKSSEKGLDVIRHSTAHLMAYAVKQLYGNIPMAIGPTIENGFYYDFDRTFSESDLPAIEKKMEEIVKKDEKFSREEISRDDALKLFSEKGEIYKVELIKDLPANEKITIYRVGDFVDLCRGPHVPSTKYLKFFKLTKVAGAYWRGDSKNKMLQRIYGTAWDSKENLDKYFIFLEEAERRDHKKIIKLMDIAHFDSEFAPGGPFYHPKGVYLYNKLISYIREKQDVEGYIEVMTPRVMDRSLWETSGHWEKYGEHNYSGKTEDEREFCIKPMNCPGGILVYKNSMHSYRDFPLKMAEFGRVNRYEASGALNGFLRVREFTQDDAHIFCTPEQVEEQVMEATQFFLDVYRDFGFDSVRIKLSTRPENRIGDEKIWDISEKALADSLVKLNLPYTIFEGEGAFYGPKLEFVLKDALGRDWQIGTIQVDMNLPERFDMTYIGEDGQKHQPVMLHRALLGSIERFIGVLTESVEGKYPLWINPLQMVVMNISNDEKDFVDEVYKKLKANKFQVEKDVSNETLNYKIRDYSLKKVPYIIIIGKKERENGEVTIRTIGSDKQETMKLDAFIARIKEKIEKKDLNFDL